jgi:hypothetical protein
MSGTKSFSVGGWIAGIAGTVVAAVLIWWLTHPGGGILNPATPTPPPPPPTPTPPHAPPIENTYGVPLFDEHQQLIAIQPGEQIQLSVMSIWSAPVGTIVDCASGFLALTWIVRDPYPTGGEDLQILAVIPQGGGRTEVVASGSQGSVTLGYCDEIFLFNNSLQKYQVEIRYASGTFQE